MRPLFDQESRGFDGVDYVTRRFDEMLGNVNLDYNFTSLEDFALEVNPAYQPSMVHRVLLRYGEKIIRDELKRLMVIVSTRIGKSEVVSKILPAAFLRVHPYRFVGMGTCESTLALDNSDVARDYFRRSGGRLRPGSKAKRLWRTLEGGGMWTTGRGGRSVGAGAQLLVVDDPLKNAEEAFSMKTYDQLQGWYEGTLFQRLIEDAAVVVCSNRWPGNDMVKYLFEREADAPQNWTIIVLDGLREDRPYTDIPSTCTVVPDWREPGESIWPERFPAEDMRNRIRVGRDLAQAVIQQRPMITSIKGRVASSYGEKNVDNDLGWTSRNGKIDGAFLACDFNVSPLFGVLGQLVGDRFHFIQEIVIKDDGQTEALARSAKEFLPDGLAAEPIAYPDPTGKKRSTASPASDHDILSQAGFIVKALAAPPPVNDRVNAFNRACGEPGFAQRVYVNADRCPVLHNALSMHRFLDGTRTPDKSTNLDHPFDAVSMAVFFETYGEDELDFTVQSLPV